MKAEISVVIPMYNKEAHIVRCLDSVLGQHHPATEIIVVDDGSTDDSAAVVARHYPDQVRLVRTPNSGVSVARNLGIKLAQGTHVALLDADDEWNPHFLSEMHLLIERFQHCELFGCAYQYCEGDHYTAPKIKDSHKHIHFEITDYFQRIARHDLLFNASSVCVAKTLIDRIGYFPQGETMGEDQDLWNRAAIHSRIAYSRNALAVYHQDSSNRACTALPPAQECPYSKRLMGAALNTQDKATQAAMLDCTANHLLNLVRRNWQAGRWEVCQRLLQDKRVMRLPLKFAVWWVLTHWCRITESGLHTRGRAIVSE